MSCKPIVLAGFVFFYTAAIEAQTAPIYRVTVIERTVHAVDYQYRTGPTKIDFRGTVLMPQAKGDATVESKTGRAEIAARFEHLRPPTRFGPEYLTYVLWAITPQGNAKNLGEVLADGSDHARLAVTTDLQAFGMIVTAEPYAAVRQPSDVVILENQIRPDTIGNSEPIQAKAELLPRGQYTYNVPAEVTAAGTNTAKLPMDRYEALLEVYQAQNAVQIARAAEADRYAADTFARAEQLLRNAQQFEARKADRSTIVTAARQAAQTAEDARIIATQRKHEKELAQARAETSREQQLRAQAEAEARLARSQESADRAQLDAERAARQNAEAEAAAARAEVPIQQSQAPVVVVQPPPAAAVPDPAKKQLRVRLLGELNAALPARDTPRGLVVTVPGADFQGVALRPEMYRRLARVAGVLAAHPGLVVAVEGNSDSSLGEREALDRAFAVRAALVRSGAPAASIAARGLGDTRLIASNASAQGREQNRRVEITISGDAIGDQAYWDKSYSLIPKP